MTRPVRLVVVAAVAAAVAFGPGCGRTGLFHEVWIDDEGRQIAVVIEGDLWTGYWAEPQSCPVTGEPRPRKRFLLRVDDQGRGVGTIGICRYGFDDCANGPVTVRFEAEVAVDRIEGTVLDRECNDYEGTEVIRRVSCGTKREPTDYLSSTVPLDWTEDSSRVESGILDYRAPRPDRTPGAPAGPEVWAISAVRGEVSLVAPTGVRVRARDGELHYGFPPAGEVLVTEGEAVYPGSRLARLEAMETGPGAVFELQLLGYTPELRPTDPHCVRGESGPVMIRGSAPL